LNTILKFLRNTPARTRNYFFPFFFLLSFGLSANSSHTKTTNPIATAEIASHVPNLSMPVS
jgi:hypothetical protein